MLLLMVADCLAAQNALTLHGQSAGDQSSPWSSDQESMIKVKDLIPFDPHALAPHCLHTREQLFTAT